MALTSRMVESRYRLGDLCNSRKNRRKAPAQLRPEFSSLLLAVSVLFPPVSLRRRQAACPQTPTLRSARCVYHVGLCVCVCLVAAKKLWPHDTVRTPGGSSILTYLFETMSTIRHLSVHLVFFFFFFFVTGLLPSASQGDETIS